MDNEIILNGEELRKDMIEAAKCRYYEWDEPNFILPDKFVLEGENDLADALEVFWSAGGFDFFNVVEPKYYAVKWLEFVGSLYSRIENREFIITDKSYIVPLSIEQKNELVNRGVPAIFITDL